MSDITTSARSSLPRNVVVLGAATFLLTLGESLWLRYAPRYLEALGATAIVVGLWGSLLDGLDAAWQAPAGAAADRFGTKRALVALTALSLVGIALFLVPVWPVVLMCLLFYMAQAAFAQPATFRAIGESLPKERRAFGFGVQSALKRVPVLVGAPVAGWLITTRLGVVGGVRAGLVAAAIATSLALAAQWLYYREPAVPSARAPRLSTRDFPPALRRLLVSDVLVRMGESATKVFLVLYVVTVLGFSDLEFGVMIALMMLVSLIVYLPAARAADRGVRKPWVAFTFAAFALFPLAVLGATSIPLLALAFAVGGLREIGEPARKAAIVDLAPEGARGRVVGAYYAVRGVAILPVAFLAGLLWTIDPALPFYAGAALSGAGLAVYVFTVPRE